MSSTSDIQAKAAEVRRKGFNLGRRVGAEKDSHSGGRLQVYQNAHIYWHQNTGAHEVHGGILQKYLAEGGPGPHPETGNRRFGYPTSDEIRQDHDPRYPVSRFEFGVIAFVAGTGGVSLYGDFRKKATRELGFPLTEPLKRGGGEVVYFERGCLYRGPLTENRVITCVVDLPPIGRTRFIDPQDAQTLEFSGLAKWNRIPIATLNAIKASRPWLFEELWNTILFVRPVVKPGTSADTIPIHTGRVAFQESRLEATVYLGMRIPQTDQRRLQGRTLYDVTFRFENRQFYVVAPHAYYTRVLWDNFGFIHATDIHVSRRIDSFRPRLKELARADRSLSQASSNFNNFNDAFRDMIRYANSLHDTGKLDLILVTGDLVDYALEDGDPGQGNNFLFLEQLILGQAPSPDDAVRSEELRVPIFTTFGNHDYRMHPYVLYGKLDIPAREDEDLSFYPPFNLTKAEVLALQGGDKPKVSLEDGRRMVRVDNFNQQGTYDYYFKRINPDTSYIVELGPHRVVMLDTRSDAGLPSGVDLQHLIALFINYAFDALSEDAKREMTGGPNLLGLLDSDIRLVRNGLSGAHELGLVIVGMHAPPLNIEGSEFNHFFRETEHPRADKRETEAYLLRHTGLGFLPPSSLKDTVRAAIYGDTDADLSDNVWALLGNAVDDRVSRRVWPRTGTGHFKTGDTEQLLDAGVASGRNTETLLKLCAGQGVRRPVDLLLCGHNHDRVEYRLKWDEAAEGFRFYTDFYTQNPSRYYPSTKVSVDGPVHVTVREDAPFNGTPRTLRDHRFNPPREYKLLDVPPYSNPLNDASNARAWWERHRPVIVETAALGPMDHSQRARGSEQPSTTFQGFRLFQIKSNVIQKCHYLTLDALRQADFVPP